MWEKIVSGEDSSWNEHHNEVMSPTLGRVTLKVWWSYAGYWNGVIVSAGGNRTVLGPLEGVEEGDAIGAKAEVEKRIGLEPPKPVDKSEL